MNTYNINIKLARKEIYSLRILRHIVATFMLM